MELKEPRGNNGLSEQVVPEYPQLAQRRHFTYVACIRQHFSCYDKNDPKQPCD